MRSIHKIDWFYKACFLERQTKHVPHTLLPSLQVEIPSPDHKKHMYKVTFASQHCTRNHQERFNPKRHVHGVTDLQNSPAIQAIETTSMAMSTEVIVDIPSLMKTSQFKHYNLNPLFRRKSVKLISWPWVTRTPGKQYFVHIKFILWVLQNQPILLQHYTHSCWLPKSGFPPNLTAGNSANPSRDSKSSDRCWKGSFGSCSKAEWQTGQRR